MQKRTLKLESLKTFEALNQVQLKAVSGGIQQISSGRDDDPHSDSSRNDQDTFKNIDGGDISTNRIIQ